MSPSKAQVFLDTNRTIAPISPLLFGGFAEHMGRCVYEGIYDPQSPHADKRGLRKDVMEALRDQAYTVIRYPGGNFLSGYDWLNGVGPKSSVRACVSLPGNPWKPINLAQTNLWSSVAPSMLRRCWA